MGNGGRLGCSRTRRSVHVGVHDVVGPGSSDDVSGVVAAATLAGRREGTLLRGVTNSPSPRWVLDNHRGRSSIIMVARATRVLLTVVGGDTGSGGGKLTGLKLKGGEVEL